MSSNGLLATKFALPGPPSGAVERPRLLAALDRCAERPLTLVAAPAGSGKSALAGAWVERGRAPGPVAWLSLDASDADPARCWRVVDTRLAGVNADELLAALAVHPLHGSDAIVSAL